MMISLVILLSLILCTAANAKTVYLTLDNNMQKNRLVVTESPVSTAVVSRLSGGTVSVDIDSHTMWDIDIPDDSYYEYSLNFMTQTEGKDPCLAYTLHMTPSKLSAIPSGYSQLYKFWSERGDGVVTIKMNDATEQSLLFLMSIGVITSAPLLFM